MKMLRPSLKLAKVSMPVIGRIGATPRQRGRAWMTRRADYLRAHPLCAHCLQAGRVAAATELDHITPLCDGGNDDASNFQGLCGPCHSAKTAREAAARAGR